MKYSRIFSGMALPVSNVVFEDFIATGGEAEVWRVRKIGFLDRALAAKVMTIPAVVSGSREAIQSLDSFLRRQGIGWAKFAEQSRNVVPLLDTIDEEFADEEGIQHRIVGFVMPFARFGSLRNLVGEDLRRLDRSAIRRMLRDIAEGLQAGHDIDQCHGDIKPENILIFEENNRLIPKLMDFGNTLGPDDMTGGNLGQPEYMAPEMYQSLRASKTADVYALGILYYEIIADQLPFYFEAGPDSFEKYRQAHTRVSPDLTPISDRFDREMADLVGDMLRKSEDRIKVAEVVSRLAAHERRSIYTKERGLQLRNVLPFKANSYRWSPIMHRDLLNRLHYVFLKGSDPTLEITWLHNKLAENGIHGYAIYRVLGGFDYLLRIWLKGDYWDRLEDILGSFRTVFKGDYSIFTVETSWPWWMKEPVRYRPVTRNLEQLQGARLDALRKLRECVDPEEEKAFVNLRDRGLVHSRLQTDESGGRKSIRFFITLRSRNHVTDSRRSELFFRMSEKLRGLKSPAATQLSIYAGGPAFEYLIKVRLRDFFAARPLLDSLLEEPNAISPAGGFTTQTYVEIDPTGFIESDDGSIVHEMALVLSGAT